MHQDSWMSLGIIITLFACMVQRLASSMRPTKYTSAASCRHKMAHLLKHRSYLPTLWAISQTNHEKGSFQIRSLCSFGTGRSCKVQQSPVGTFGTFSPFQPSRIPSWGPYLPLWDWASFWLAPPHPTWMAPPLQPSGPTVGLAMTMATSLFPPAVLLPPPSSSSGRASAVVAGGFTGVGCCWDCVRTSDLVPTCIFLSCLPFLDVTLVLAILEFRQKENQPIRRQSGLSRVIWCPFWIFNQHDIISSCLRAICFVAVLPSFFHHKNVWWLEKVQGYFRMGR